jgi:hypothetical protein
MKFDSGIALIIDHRGWQLLQAREEDGFPPPIHAPNATMPAPCPVPCTTAFTKHLLSHHQVKEALSAASARWAAP